jgi:hypothetical protein
MLRFRKSKLAEPVSGKNGSAVIRKNVPNRKWKTSTASLVAQFKKPDFSSYKFHLKKEICLNINQHNKPVKKIISHQRPKKVPANLNLKVF